MVHRRSPRTLADLHSAVVDTFLGFKAAKLWNLDLDTPAPVVDEVGFTMAELRAPCPTDADLNDDVHRPLA